ncbi:unnamed protein product [Bemisia tabaci]|uniref:RdRp catalytic domain-containing protein n=1 Tax=Bemisia tabaci TaxID=7038 RepID=A0A9P0F6H4_BEMTA|nr:unnamed protein product [Bemisia tabaci]
MQSWINNSSDDLTNSDSNDKYAKQKKKKRKKKKSDSNLISDFISDEDDEESIDDFLKESTSTKSHGGRKDRHGKPKKTQRDIWKETRLLLYYMVNEKEAVNHLKYIQEFCENENIDFAQFLDYLVIRIVPKEKEMKVDFRGYGCKTFMDRARSVISEHNIANYLGKYCHEQAITLSELEIMNRLVSFRRLAKAYRN